MTGERFDLSRPRRLHLIGVGGSGMSAIAEVLNEEDEDEDSEAVSSDEDA